MTSEAIAAFNVNRLDAQYALFGKSIKISGTDGTGCYNAPSFRRNLEEGGFKTIHEASLRIRKSQWTAYTAPLQFEKVTVQLQLNGTWTSFGVTSATDVSLAGEWKLELAAMT